MGSWDTLRDGGSSSGGPWPDQGGPENGGAGQEGSEHASPGSPTATSFGAMPILADALQDAGCDNDDILNHCRDTSLTHVRGCWVIDLLTGRE